MAKKQGKDLQYLRHSNLNLILSTIWDHSPISRFELSKATGLTPSSITRLILELEQLGLVRETGKGKSTGGRNPIIIEPNPDAGVVISIDLSGFNLNAGVFNSANGLIHRIVRPLTENGRSEIEALIVAVIQDLLAQPAAQAKKLLGIGLTFPGTIDYDAGMVIDSYKLHLHHFPVRAFLAERFHVPVYIENDASTAALAEYNYGVGKDHRNLLYVFVSNGIGAGIILDGKVYRGDTGRAGEIGHMIVNKDGPTCICGKRGCLEVIASVPALLTNVQRIMTQINSDRFDLNLAPGAEVSGAPVHQIVKAATEGNRIVLDIISNAADYLALAISNYVTTLDVRHIVIGADVVELRNIYVSYINHYLAKYTQSGQEIKIQAAHLAPEDILRGMSIFTIQETLKL